MRVQKQGSHFSSDTNFYVFSKLFPGQINEMPGQFGVEPVFLLIMYVDNDVNQIIFVNNILKSESWNTNYKTSKFFPGLELKFQVFPTFWANSRYFPGLEK